jgi:hypothetical protein
MSSTVTGNAGTSSAQGVQVTAIPLNTSGVGSIAQCDSSGNYSLSLAAGSYNLVADTRNVTSGAYLGFVYRQSIPITVDGVTAQSGVNFVPPVNPNTVNTQY